jgi:hypothetical protein
MLNSGNSLQAFAGVGLSDTTINTPRVSLAIFNGASGFAGASDWLSGGTSGNTGATGTIKFATGAYNDGLFGSVCKIAEVAVISAAVSTAQKQSMAAYFSSRYGITIT